MTRDSSGTAVCLTCGWTAECESDRSALGVGARHHQRLGHRVSVELTTTVVFESEGAVEQQESLI